MIGLNGVNSVFQKATMKVFVWSVAYVLVRYTNYKKTLTVTLLSNDMLFVISMTHASNLLKWN